MKHLLLLLLLSSPCFGEEEYRAWTDADYMAILYGPNVSTEPPQPLAFYDYGKKQLTFDFNEFHRLAQKVNELEQRIVERDPMCKFECLAVEIEKLQREDWAAKIKELEKRIEELEKNQLKISTGTFDFDSFLDQMMINPSIYTCTICGKTFRNTNTKTSCAVFHGTGSCCHYMDEEIK